MNKGDIVVIIVGVIIAACAFMFYQNIADTSQQQILVVRSAGDEIKRVPLNNSTNQTFDINTSLGHNKIKIVNGEVSIIEASCPNQICVDTPHIHFAGQSIICLPNKLSVEIISDNTGEVDDVAY